jgi:hypothetical protein
MSQINDALKRAQQRTSGSAVPTLPSVAAQPERRSGKWLLPSFIVLLVAGAGLLICLAWIRPQPKPSSPPVGVPSIRAPNAIPETMVVPMKLSNPPPPQAVTIDTSKRLPKLQGILYDPVHPEAIVNGKTYHIGSPIGDNRVKAISKSSMTLTDVNGVETVIYLAK